MGNEGDATDEPAAQGSTPDADASCDVLSLAPNCPATVRTLVADLVDVQSEALAGDLANGPALADSVIALARVRNMLEAEIGRRLSGAVSADCLRHTPRTTLIAAGGWAGSSAAAMVAAAQFADSHDTVAALWRSGAISVESVAALARGLSPLSPEDQAKVITGVLPHLPHLSVRAVRRFVARAVDILDPHDRDRREQRRHDQRFLAFSSYCGSLTFHGQLPELEGAAFRTALAALAESIRAEGDGLTTGQRYADALITMVNAAATHQDLPATAGGLPVAASVTISLTEAERLVVAPGAGGPDTTLTLTGEPALLSGTETTLGDAAARFVMCCADLTGVIVRRRGAGDSDTTGTPMTPVSLVAQTLAGTRLEPLALGRSTRFATRAQRVALAVRDRGCVIPGCQRPPNECQTHHVTEWSQGGRTDLESLALLCWTHHRQVDLNRWRLVRNPDPVGPFWLVTPVRRHAWIQRRVA